MVRLNDLQTFLRLGQSLLIVDAQLLKHSNTMLEATGSSIALECTDLEAFHRHGDSGAFGPRNPCMVRLHDLQTFPWLGQ
jgi:hypothetical protein